MSARVGVGYDAHRFAPGRGGWCWAGSRSHTTSASRGTPTRTSLTHAVIDAILGAAGQGDLGTLFPPDEERWRDADSLDLLTVALGKLRGRVVNVDATVICEEPQIDPHRAEMERNLADTLSAAVSVKATTNEGMGWIGRGEGIACVAVALVELD